MAIRVDLTDVAGIDVGESAETTGIALAESARIENRTLSVGRARLRAAFSLATFVTGQTLRNGLDADGVDTCVQSTRVVFFAAAVTVVGTSGHADALLTNLAVITSATAVVLGGCASRRWEHKRQHRDGRGSKQAPPLLVSRQAAS
jgi:hypothetical protein